MSRKLRFVLAIASAVLLSLAWLGFPGWILFIAFLPLLILDDFFVANQKNYRSVSFWGYGLLCFLLWNILTTWWIGHATTVGAAMAILLNSFLMSIVWWIAHIARRRFKGSLGYVALAAFYLAFEFCHYHWEIEWPWLTLGNGFANNIRLVQWYEFTGVFGGSLWVLAINVVLFRLLKKIAAKEWGKLFYLQSAFLFVLIFIPIFISGIIYSHYTEAINPKEFVVVQPNIDPYSESYSVVAEAKKLDKFIGLARGSADSKTDLIIGPETVFERYPDWEENNLQNLAAFRELQNFVSSLPKAELVVGVSSSKVFRDGEKIPETARKRGVVKFDVYNSAFFFKKDGGHEVYHKSILVSGVEKVPYLKYLGFLKNIIIDLGGASGSLGKQDGPSVFKTSGGAALAPVICYESVFGEYLSKFIKKGAGYIVIITNDGWWKNTPGYRQHMSFARLRAVETRRSIARAANTGISCFINQRGDILQKTNWWEEAVIKEKLNANDKLTFYVENGDYIARIAAFMSIMLVLILISDIIRKKPGK